MVRVKPSIRPTETYTEPNFLRLHTYSRPSEPDIRLASLEHMSYEPPSDGGSSGWSCQTIVDGEAMSKEDALFIARTYAKENHIPVIYESHGD